MQEIKYFTIEELRELQSRSRFLSTDSTLSYDHRVKLSALAATAGHLAIFMESGEKGKYE